MFCIRCGKTIEDGTKFCPYCGEKVEKKTENAASSRLVRLKCISCGGMMQASPDQTEIVCPYCGEHMLMTDSDEVAAQKVRSAALKDIELARLTEEKEKRLAEKERREQEEKRQDRTRYEQSKLRKWTVIFALICLITSVISFRNHHIACGIVSMIQSFCFIISWLMGMQILPEKPKRLHSALAAAGFVLIIAFVIVGAGSARAAGGTRTKTPAKEETEKLVWPMTGLAAELPRPEAEYGKVGVNSNEYFSADLYQVDAEDFEKYTLACREKGYTVDAQMDGSRYKARNQSGRELSIWYNSGDSRIDITLSARTNEEESSGTDDPPKEGKTSAEELSKDGEALTDDPSKDGKASDAVPSKDGKAPDDGGADGQASTVRSEGTDTDFRAFADSYEAFIDEYIEFMIKYKKSGNSVTMLTEYLDMMNRYLDFTAKAADYQSDDMSAGDLAYYLEVMSRCTKKLSDASSEMN